LGIFAGCCASAETQSEKSMEQTVRTVIFFFMYFSLPLATRHSPLDTRPFSLDYPIRPREHFWRNCQTNLFRCLQVDDEFKLRCLLHGQISRFGTFQDLVHVNSSAPMEVNDVCPIGHEATGFHKLLLEVNSRQAVFASKLDDLFSFGEKLTTSGRHDRAHLLLLCGLKGAL